MEKYVGYGLIWSAGEILKGKMKYENVEAVVYTNDEFLLTSEDSVHEFFVKRDYDDRAHIGIRLWKDGKILQPNAIAKRAVFHDDDHKWVPLSQFK